MTGEFRGRIEQRDGVTRVEFLGPLDEHSDLSALAQQLTDDVVIDLAEVRRINSCGVREWIEFIDQLSARGSMLSLERCSVAFVCQLNLIAGFSGCAKVRSIYAPYLCPACDRDHRVLIDLGGNPSEEIRRAVSCPQCGATLELDYLPDAYLSFLSG